MSVVLRCPNCGTTRATPGACEACNEASVRYFCSNHQPGIWIAERTCPQCGARFGGPARVPAAAVSSSPAPPTAATLEHRRERGARPIARSASASVRVPPPRSARPAPRVEGEEPEVGSLRTAPWQELLNVAMRVRGAAISARGPAKPALVFAGCLRRMLVIVVILVIAFGLALSFFGRALRQAFQVY